MRNKILVIFFATALTHGLCLAQENETEDFVTSRTTQEGKEYPKVNSEGRVTAVCLKTTN